MLQTYHTTLTKKENLAGDVWRFVFAMPQGERLDFKAGQYMILRVGEVRRLYSVSSPQYQKDSFELTVGILPDGVASNLFSDMKEGDAAEFQGPAGFFALASTDKPKVFLSAGTGIAPTRSQLYTLLEGENPTSAPLYLFWGTPTCDMVYYEDDWKLLAEKHANFKYMFCVDCEDSLGARDADRYMLMRIDHAFKRNMADKMSADELNGREYYLCGRREIVESLRKFLSGLGIDTMNIHFDKF